VNETYDVARIVRGIAGSAQISVVHSLKCLQASQLLSQWGIDGTQCVRQPGIAVMFSLEWRTSFNALPLNVQIQLK
jgi:hypothetical protein